MDINFSTFDWAEADLVRGWLDQYCPNYGWSYNGTKEFGYKITIYGLDMVTVGSLGMVFPKILFREKTKTASVLDKALGFLDNVKEILKEKNKAYGDSAANPLRIFSKSDKDEAIKVRIDDKLSRIARGDGSGNEDAIKDLVGYLSLLAGGIKNSDKTLDEALLFLDGVKKDLNDEWSDDPNLTELFNVFVKTTEDRIKAEIDSQLVNIDENVDCHNIHELVFELALLAGVRK